MVMKDMCAECGADLRRLKESMAPDKKGNKQVTSASVAMIHSVPELIVSEEQALELGRQDEQRLLKHRKLVLLVDLDQTLLHTTNDNIPPNLKDVHHFQLWHNGWIWYHTKFRPGTKEFLESISKYYELHICTFGVRMYAHTIASILDPDKKYFSYRILSRDECFSANSKTANMRALFPCGDSMVCIIDDRDDVWKSAPNLIHVKPYHFFCGTADINAPPGLGKETDDGISHRHNVNIIRIPKKKTADTKGHRVGNKLDTASRNSTDSSDKQNFESLQDSVRDSEHKDMNEPQQESISEMETENVDKDTVKDIVKDSFTESERETEEEANSNTKSDINDGSENSTMDSKQGDCQGSQTAESAKADEDIGFSGGDGTLKDEEVSGQEEVSLAEAFSPVVDVAVETSTSAAAPAADDQVSDQVCNDLELSDSSGNESETEAAPAEKDATLATPDGDNIQNMTMAKCEAGEQPQGLEESQEDNTSLNSSHGNRSTEKEEGEVTSEDDRCDNESKKADVEEYEEIIEWEDTDDYLLYLETILKKIHRVYYEMYDETKERQGEELPDLKKIIPYMRSKVLKGANLLFSGVIPTNQPLERSHAYQVAKSLGANVHSVFIPKDASEDNATTHLVAAKLGTSKVNQVKKHKDVHIVNPDWLWTCMDRWEWVEERLYPLSEDASYPFTDSPEPWKQKKTKAVKGAPGLTKKNSEKQSANDKEKFTDYNPLYAFSSSDIKKMDEEVDEIFDESESEDSELELRRAVLSCSAKRQRESSSSSEESLTAEYPKGWDPRKKRTRITCNSAGGCDDNGNNDDDDDENNVEREEMDDDENEIGRKIMEDPSSMIRLSDQSSSDDNNEYDEESDPNNPSIGSIDDEMAEALEREFLSN